VSGCAPSHCNEPAVGGARCVSSEVSQVLTWTWSCHGLLLSLSPPPSHNVHASIDTSTARLILIYATILGRGQTQSLAFIPRYDQHRRAVVGRLLGLSTQFHLSPLTVDMVSAISIVLAAVPLYYVYSVYTGYRVNIKAAKLSGLPYIIAR
jgi:hypothetical protein